MRLTLQADYALRMLMQLAVNPDRRITIADVAGRYGISKNHLMKVAQALGHEGLILTERGRTGGLQLALPARDIRIGDVVRRMEGNIALVECFPGGAGLCHIAPGCRLKGVLHEAVEAFFAVLDRYSLHDLVKGNPALGSLLLAEAGP